MPRHCLPPSRDLATTIMTTPTNDHVAGDAAAGDVVIVDKGDDVGGRRGPDGFDEGGRPGPLAAEAVAASPLIADDTNDGGDGGIAVISGAGPHG